LCGAVSFVVEGDLKGPDACHCTQCRKVSGHFWASTDVPKDAIRIEGAEKLTWFHSSEKVRRGFCSVCGSALFWDPVAHPFIGVAMGAFDAPTGTHLHVHIYTGSKGDYYEIGDDVPQYETVPPRP
jgi:hypothetical protein